VGSPMRAPERRKQQVSGAAQPVRRAQSNTPKVAAG
jgi:hypothetical protein